MVQGPGFAVPLGTWDHESPLVPLGPARSWNELGPMFHQAATESHLKAEGVSWVLGEGGSGVHREIACYFTLFLRWGVVCLDPGSLDLEEV